MRRPLPRPARSLPRPRLTLVPLPHSQHALFAILTFISCAVSLGYFYNMQQVYLVHRYQEESFYWRNFIWSVLFALRLSTRSTSSC